MNRLLGVILLVAGGAIGWYGWQRKETLGARLNQLVDASGANEPYYIMGVGIVVAVAGLVLLLRSAR